jgi:methyl-accepting chemotaxis protein
VDKEQGGIMTGRFKRRQLFVHPIQYWFVVTTLIYFVCILVVLYGIVVLPMVRTLDDQSVPWQERAQAATQFLDFNERIWPWLLVTFLGLLLHSIYFMHRIAGPLYRFKALFQSIGAGNLFQRAKLREHDYLQREAGEFNAMLDQLEQRIESLNVQCANVTSAYQDVAQLIQGRSPDHANATLLTLEEEVSRLRANLDEFRLRTPQPPMNSSAKMKAA